MMEFFFCEQNVPNVREVVLNTDITVTMRDPNCEEHSPRELSTQTEEAIGGLLEEIVDIENITVKFRLSDTQVIAQVYPNRLILGDIKKDIARRFEVKPELICLKQNGRQYCNECKLLETCCDEFGIHEFELSVQKTDPCQLDGDLPKLDINVYYDKHRLADFITVHIPPDNPDIESARNVVVEIENKAIVKPYLCGYKDLRTGISYMDAYTQTGPYFDKWKYRRYISRDTQTQELKQKLIDTPHDQSTQCFLDDNNVIYVAAAMDYTITPGKYQTYAQKMRIENKLAKIKLIQRNWRRYLKAKKAERERRLMIAEREAEEQYCKEQKLLHMKREQRVKLFPRTSDDFDLLIGEIYKWKMAELKRITRLYDGPARIAETNLLLDREIQMLAGLERQRRLVQESMKDFRDKRLLTKMGESVKWVGYKDLRIDCDLLRTQRVRFLSELYKDFKKPAGKEERLVLLRKVKELLVEKERDFPGFAEVGSFIVFFNT